MENKWLYFIMDDYIASADDSSNDIAPGPRIFKTPINFPISLNAGDGPYNSIRNLKRNSQIFKRLIKTNSKRVQQILKDENIVELTNTFIPYPRNKGIPQDMLRMISHCTNGHIVKGKVYGVHFYDSSKIEIVKVLEKDDCGIWSAQIKNFDKKANSWILKENSSTFFPINWTLHQLFYECMHAMENPNKKLIEGAKNKYISTTISGIQVHLIIVDNRLKTIYPIIGTNHLG